MDLIKEGITTHVFNLQVFYFPVDGMDLIKEGITTLARISIPRAFPGRNGPD